VGVHSSTITAGANLFDANVFAHRQWIDDTCDGCLSSWTAPPSAYEDEDKSSDFCSNDADGDSVPNWKANCPDVPNADQANCNADDDLELHGVLPA